MQILFASMPFDGHLLPMTGVAQRLVELGHDVRFYTGPSYAERLARLGVAHEPFRRATEVTAQNIEEHYPQLATMNQRQRAQNDPRLLFFANIEAHYRDVVDIYASFPFEVLVHDAPFYAAYPISRKLHVPSFATGPSPTPTAKSAGAPPPFFGFAPARGVLDRIKHRAVWAVLESSNRSSKRDFDALLASEGLPPYDGSFFQLPWETATTVFQAGTASMDFEGIHWPANHQFVGPLLPPAVHASGDLPFAHRLEGRKVVVVSQGTLDNRDPDKLFVPTLTALASDDPDAEHVVVATTGGRHTEDLRRRFPRANVIIEDWVDFPTLLPHADVFVGNGGYGSAMHALVHAVPLVLAGQLECKNDINARLAHRGLAIDLRTETPAASDVGAAVERVLADPGFRERVGALSTQLRSHRPIETICEAVVGAAHPAGSPA